MIDGGVSYKTDTSSKTIEPPIQTNTARVLKWTGVITTQKWMIFYTKVLSKFAIAQNLKLTLKVSISVEGDISSQKIEDTKVALQELGLDSDIKLEN
ncbi:AAA family ATPase [Calothrix sp. NIES-4071]|nr:AAA family ATPase [Calothrix sp. NIES-4071]BAZ63040.1 AAA family ATPase [Calothrix sp. NIES-4105]